VSTTLHPPEAAPRWKPWSAPLALLAGFAAALVGAIVVGIVGSIAGASVNHPPPSIQIIDTIVQDGALVAAAAMFAHNFGRFRPQDFGLRAVRIGPAVGRTITAGLAFLFFLFAWSAVLNIHDKEKLVQQLGANRSVVTAAAVALLVSVIAPFCEEFVFRGYFFGALANWRGPWPAAILTGIVFGAIHVGSTPVLFLVPLAFFGFALCWLRWKTGSLYPGIALHSLNNSLALGVGLSWGWQIPVVMVGSLALLGLVAVALSRTIAQPVASQ
jgi:membrane protease YdiL (CAAX protease family)